MQQRIPSSWHMQSLTLRSQKSDITLAHAFFDCNPSRSLTAIKFCDNYRRKDQATASSCTSGAELLNARVRRPTTTFTQCWVVLQSLVDRLGAVLFTLDCVSIGADIERGRSVSRRIFTQLLGIDLKSSRQS